MGLLSNILGTETSPAKLNQQESFLGILLSAVAADGHISDEETADFISIANKAKVVQDMSGQQFNSTIDKLFKILRRDGVDQLVELSVKGLPPDLRLGTFTIACDLLFSDGSVEKEEEQVLEKLIAKLEINEANAMKVVEVISIKNKV